MLVIARPAYACSCGITSLEERVASMESIVVGTVRELDGEMPAYDLTVEVDEYLMGSGPDIITIRAGWLGTAACSAFDSNAIGRTHLLFLSRDEAGRFRTSLCDGSHPIYDMERDYMETVFEQIRLLAAGGPAPATESPLASPADELPPAGSGGDLPEQSNAWLFLGIAGASLGVAGLGVLLRHGTRRP
jgi:hypothetical protein